MGGGSKSRTKETALSKEQAATLKTHEAQYQSVLFPALRAMITKDIDINSVEMSPWLMAQQDEFTSAFGQAETLVDKTLAERGIARGGVGSLIRGNLQQGGASQRVGLLQQAVGQQQGLKTKAMEMFSQHSPSSSGAAPLSSKKQTAGNEAELLGKISGAAFGNQKFQNYLKG